MNILPTHDRVLLKRIAPLEVTTGGLIIPEAAKEKPQAAIVVAVGPGRLDKTGERLSMFVHTGDHVLFGKYSGQEFEFEGEQYLFAREDEILGVFEK